MEMKLLKVLIIIIKKNKERIMGNLLNNISLQWNEEYDLLYEEVNNNLNNFKNSIIEFRSLAQIYSALIV